MTSYIIDTHRHEVVKAYDNIFKARCVMTYFYAWKDYKRYKLMHDKDEAYEYWRNAWDNSSERYEGLGVSENRLFDMFEDWIKE